jgi:uncharacterized protein (TIGR02145 family)
MKRILIFQFLVLMVWACEKNGPPVITEITCSPESRSAGTLFTFKAKASDADGNALLYHWSADGGVFTDSINKDQTKWKSPVDGSGNTFTIKVTVSDGKLETFLDYPVSLSEPVFGHVSGYAYFKNCTIPVAGAVISVSDKSAVSDSNGYFELRDIPVGTYSLKAAKEGFSTASLTISIMQSVNLKVTIPMISVSLTSKLYGIVKIQDTLPVAGATVTMLNPDNTESKLTTTTNSVGYYRLWYVPNGTRQVVVRRNPTDEFVFETDTLDLTLTGLEYQLNIEMKGYNLKGQFTDGRDNHQYSYKIIGSQTWMTENLAYLPAVSPPTVRSDFNKLYYVYGYEGTSVSSAMATENYATYGVLYNWKAAITGCPFGWHLPSEAEWLILANYLGPNAGLSMKSAFGWTSHGNGNNSSGFNAVPAGQCLDSNPFGFSNLGEIALIWTTTASTINSHYLHFSLDSEDDAVGMGSSSLKSGHSVRCLKD